MKKKNIYTMFMALIVLCIGGLLMILEEICYWLEHKNDRDHQIPAAE